MRKAAMLLAVVLLALACASMPETARERLAYTEGAFTAAVRSATVAIEDDRLTRDQAEKVATAATLGQSLLNSAHRLIVSDALEDPGIAGLLNEVGRITDEIRGIVEGEK